MFAICMKTHSFLWDPMSQLWQIAAYDSGFPKVGLAYDCELNIKSTHKVIYNNHASDVDDGLICYQIIADLAVFVLLETL